MERIHNTYWITHYKAHPLYRKCRLKLMNTGYPRFDIDPELIDYVGAEEFCRIEDDRISFFVGSQFGIIPRINEVPGFFNGEKQIAILGKSLLSGTVSGLTIYGIGENDSKFNYNKIISFTNSPVLQKN